MPLGITRDAQAVAAVRAARLAEARAEETRRVGALFAAARLLFISDGPGQEMLYMEKRAAAEAYVAELATGSVDLMDPRFDLVRCDIGRTGIETALQAAQVILNNASAWRVLASAMESIRGPAVDAIAEAPLDDVRGLVAGARAALVALLGAYGGVPEEVLARLPG